MIVVEVALGGVLVLIGHKASGLHVLYGLLPLLVSFIAEQLRIASAQMVLDRAGSSRPPRSASSRRTSSAAWSLAIVQREMGVMALAAFVIVVLLVTGRRAPRA